MAVVRWGRVPECIAEQIPGHNVAGGGDQHRLAALAVVTLDDVHTADSLHDEDPDCPGHVEPLVVAAWLFDHESGQHKYDPLETAPGPKRRRSGGDHCKVTRVWEAPAALGGPHLGVVKGLQEDQRLARLVQT